MARRWLEQLVSGEAIDIEAIAAREGLTERSMRMMLSLALPRARHRQAASTASLPRGFGVSRLTTCLPIDRAAPRGWTNDPVLNATWFATAAAPDNNFHQARRAASLGTEAMLVVRPTDVNYLPKRRARRNV